MKPLITGFFLACATSFALSAAELNGHIPAHLEKFAKVSPLATNIVLSLSFGLPLHNQAALDQLLLDLYNPGSTNYHKFLSVDEFATRFGPTPSEYNAVLSYASSNNLKVVSSHRNRLVVDVSGQVSAVERAFGVHMNVYKHPTEARQFFSPASAPLIPDNVPVRTIEGISDYNLPKIAQAQISGATAGYNLRKIYTPGVALNGQGQSLGLFEFSGYYMLDITNYAAVAGITNYPPIVNVLLDGYSGVPGSSGIPAGWNMEPALDIEVVMAMVPGLNQIKVYEGLHANSILAAMASDTSVKQFSSSWLQAHNTTTDSLYAEMAAQGQSFLQASGDMGAWLGSTAATTDPNLTVVDNPNITVVGGTIPSYTSTNTWAGETTWGPTGGGISYTYPLPSWQQGIANSTNGASATMRNIPDVAMLAKGVHIMYGNGYGITVDGTSISAPLWASFIAMVNQQATSVGKPAVGFLNPTLYSLGKSSNYKLFFHDITTGNNITTNGGYYACSGYDLCTGWGSPNGMLMINALLGVTNPSPGSVQVTITPTNIATVASWALDGITSYSSGYLLTNVSPTVHTVSFSPVQGWTTPASQNITINGGTTNQLSGTYVQLAASKVVFSPTTGNFSNAATIKVSSQTADTIIYTTDGLTWTTLTTNNAVIVLNGLPAGSGQITAYACKAGFVNSSNSVSGIYSFTAASPNITYVWTGGNVAVTLLGASITPNSMVTWPQVNGPITAPGTYNYTVTAPNYKTISGAITILQATNPVISLQAGVYSATNKTIITTAEKAASLYYSTNSSPWQLATTNSVSLSVNQPTLAVRAYVVAPNKLVSGVTSAYYILQAGNVTMTPSSGTFSNATSLKLTSTAASGIAYSLNGVTWTNQPGTNVVLALDGLGSGSGTVTAYAYKTGCANSTNTTGAFAFTCAGPNIIYTWNTNQVSVTLKATSTTTNTATTWSVSPTNINIPTSLTATVSKSGYISSIVTVNIAKSLNPVVSLPAGIYANTNVLTLSTSEANTKLVYQFNSTTWITSATNNVKLKLSQWANTLTAYSISSNALVSSQFQATYYTNATAPTGYLTVTLSPTNILSKGAAWIIDATNYPITSGGTVTLTMGMHTVSFTPVTGWVAPVTSNLMVTAYTTNKLTFTYKQIPVGNLTVNLSPAGAISSGATWSLDGGAQNPSGTTLSGIYSGTHSVTFSSIPGWTAPATKSIVVPTNSTLISTGIYTAMSGSYAGVFFNTNTPNVNNAGYFALTIATNHVYTGHVLVGTNTYALSGTMTPTGIITGSYNGNQLQLVLSSDNKNISGQVILPDVSSSLVALLIPYGNGVTCTQKGNYTFVIPPTEPTGYGFGSLTVSTNGVVAGSGMLGDDTGFKLTGNLVIGGYWPVYIPESNGQGVIVGWSQFAATQVSDLAGTLNWSLLGDSTPLNDSADLIGSAYTRTSTNMINKVLSVEVSTPDHNFSVTNYIALLGTGVITNLGPTALTMTLGTNGVFSGTIELGGTQQPFAGAILQKGLSGYGLFPWQGTTGSVEIK